MAFVARKALMPLVTKLAVAIKVAMIPTAVPAFPAATIERAIGRIAVAIRGAAAVAIALRASGQEETDANQQWYRRRRYSVALHRRLHSYEVRRFPTPAWTLASTSCRRPRRRSSCGLHRCSAHLGRSSSFDPPRGCRQGGGLPGWTLESCLEGGYA